MALARPRSGFNRVLSQQSMLDRMKKGSRYVRETLTTTPPGYFSHISRQHSHQRSPTLTNAHQRSPTFTNAHQRSPTLINAHQRSSTLTNTHQHIRDAPKHSRLFSLYALMADAFYCGGKTSRPQTIKAGGLGIRRSIAKKIQSLIYDSGDWFAPI
ncbi:hypothetical protein PENSOL_c040G05347 [Penicillium solitum]|uniref:Uncharacterized protein n=1 Tax=Penicillium solitum TaxID=60172 RepID=A0A1V6QUI0_9EURO|nr:uncharacterized protein PENSOL_c040G05347 [Penicillium solitum]OQD92576.1 hypothetical protein PENSOL_c040G05347 [Penicillium solitum]